MSQSTAGADRFRSIRGEKMQRENWATPPPLVLARPLRGATSGTHQLATWVHSRYISSYIELYRINDDWEWPVNVRLDGS